MIVLVQILSSTEKLSNYNNSSYICDEQIFVLMMGIIFVAIQLDNVQRFKTIQKARAIFQTFNKQDVGLITESQSEMQTIL